MDFEASRHQSDLEEVIQGLRIVFPYSPYILFLLIPPQKQITKNRFKAPRLCVDKGLCSLKFGRVLVVGA